ncbi:MAG: non-canonical purine NTP pyrophosphatase [Candidatus Portnoybacteria bacterium]|nr:non-canonical purine NTP pyrophosphatase [Candidatus Portnoybacteria bacterium]
MKIFVGTTNPAKFRDTKRILERYGYEVVGARELGLESVEENGDTLKENALHKAKLYAKRSGLPTVADDAGLEIEALGGEPGVRSRRIGDETDETIIRYIMRRMEGVKDRNARFHTVVAFSFSDGTVYTSEVVVKGIIPAHASEKRDKGYPYRSLFYFPHLHKYSIDLSLEEYEQYSSRTKALKRLIIRLKKQHIL